MKILVFFVIFIISTRISLSLIINEIMADPIADESLNEWIELYNNDSISIDAGGWVIGDNKDNDTIEGGLYNKQGTVIEAFGFAVLTDDTTRVYNNFNVSTGAIKLYIDDSSIGDSLSNDGETVYLYDNNGNLIDKKTYNKTTEDLSWSYLNATLHKSNPTPGYSNDIVISEQCDYAVDFILAKTVFDNASEFTFRIRASKIKGASTNFTVRAKIEDISGRIIKEYIPFTNEAITKQRTSLEYTPNLKEGKSYLMKSNLTTLCNDTSAENNFDARIITIKGSPLGEQSFVEISQVLDLGSDKKARFGQTVRARLNIYKGNTNKKSVAVWIEDRKGNKLSKQSKINLEEKFTDNSFTIPLQIKPNCNKKFADDNYKIIASGLDSEDEAEIEIEALTDSMCVVKIVKDGKSSAKKFNFELIDFNRDIEVGEEFNAKVELDNNNDEDINIKVWSYIYRGPKSYSGNREKNMKELILKANSLQVIELNNIVDDAEPGNYKFKVLVNKNGQKTNSEIIRDVVINNLKVSNVDAEYSESIAENIMENEITANAVSGNYGLAYESSTEKTKNLALLFLAILSVLLNIVLIWRR